MALPISLDQLKQLLIGDGVIDRDRFDEVAAEAARKNQDLIDVLIAERVVDPDYLDNMIAKALGVERVNFAASNIDREIVKSLPEDVARSRQVILFSREADGTYDAAMTDPSDLGTREFLEKRLKAKVRPFFATHDDLNRGFSVYGYELGQDFKKLIDDNIRQSLLAGTEDASAMAANLPIIAIVDNILSYALASRASDVHIEILDDATYIRYRIDGILYEIMSIPKQIHSAVVARIKLLSGLKLDEHYSPQDGRFRYELGTQSIDVRVSVMPTFYGEKVEMRLLESSQKPLSLEELGLSSDDAAIIMENLKKAYGMIISSGPTGSGKTTTLYALMNILNKPQVNVTTIEDPIEYNMRYVNQTQINPQAGITFASGLRALLRQDPNIIMVGEVRDAETADISVQAALTGHLLLSSLHTNDAPSAVPRLFDLGVPPFLVSSVLNMIIAQRLVRRICQTCIYSYDADDGAVATMKEQLKRTLAGAEPKVNLPTVLYRGKGCTACGGTGYRGRIGIFEVMQIEDTVKEIVSKPQFSLDELRTQAGANGMATMFEDGLRKVQLAQTTLEEVLRVIRE